MTIIIKFGENNVFGPKYIDGDQYRGLEGGEVHGSSKCFVYYS